LAALIGVKAGHAFSLNLLKMKSCKILIIECHRTGHKIDYFWGTTKLIIFKKLL
jgi:hypothetical protein